MTIGASAATCEAELSATFQATAFSVTTLYVQLHTGDPGAAGTANIATNNTRKSAAGCFGTAPSVSSGVVTIANDALIGTWTSVPATETYSHASFWDASTSGTFRGSATITGGAVTIGDTFDIPVGDCVITKNCAA